jgi:8-oxo-dGTP pyrophosphatase MutT (NUDIX family)
VNDLPGRSWQPGEPLADVATRWEVAESRSEYDGGFVSVRMDTVVGPDGERFDRSVVEHKDAVGILAVDDDDRVLLLAQYRHAVGQRLLEIPAGLMDVDGEPPQETAARELAEEASLAAGQWELLLEMYPSPGFCDERWSVYLARDLSVAPDSEFVREHEEAEMEAIWVPMDEAVRAVLERRITDSLAVGAILAAHARHPHHP